METKAFTSKPATFWPPNRTCVRLHAQQFEFLPKNDFGSVPTDDADGVDDAGTAVDTVVEEEEEEEEEEDSVDDDETKVGRLLGGWLGSDKSLEDPQLPSDDTGSSFDSVYRGNVATA